MHNSFMWQWFRSADTQWQMCLTPFLPPRASLPNTLWKSHIYRWSFVGPDWEPEPIKATLNCVCLHLRSEGITAYKMLFWASLGRVMSVAVSCAVLNTSEALLSCLTSLTEQFMEVSNKHQRFNESYKHPCYLADN